VSKALNRGKWIVIPETPVTINQKQQIAWYEFDPETRFFEGIFPSGKHQGMVEEAAINYVMGCTCGSALQYLATIEVGVILGMTAGMDHFINCCLQNPGADCFGRADVCGPAVRDAIMLCDLYGKLCGAAQLNPLPFLGVPDLMTYLNGDPCHHGAKLGLYWFGCTM